MRTEIRRIQRELGVTTILVTHDQIEATTMADRVRGDERRPRRAGRRRPMTSTSDPQRCSSRASLARRRSTCSTADARQRKLRVRETALRFRDSASVTVVLGVRPESVRVDGIGTPARIAAVEPMGREVLYTAEAPLGVIRFLEAGAEARHARGRQRRHSLSRPRRAAVRQDERQAPRTRIAS